LDSANRERFSLSFDKDVYLHKVGLKGFTGGLEVAELIVAGVTNTITPVDCVAATAETGLNIYTFVDAVLIEADAVVEIVAPSGQWSLGNLVVGMAESTATATTLLADWLSQYAGSLGVNTNLTDDADGDSMNNLLEYAMGGNPGIEDATTLMRTAIEDSSGSNHFDFVYSKRTDSDLRGISYEVVLEENLVFASGWTNAGYEVIEGPVVEGIQTITNRISTDEKQMQFIKLTIELNL
jgi:hypothetical protein